MARKQVIVMAVVACLLAGGVILLGPTLAGPPATPRETMAAPSTTATMAPPTDPPRQEELATLGTAFDSGSKGALLPYVAFGSAEQLDSNFAEGLKNLGLVIQEGSVQETAPGVWAVLATDRTGKKWEIGLTRAGNQLKMIYAEAVQ